VRIRPAALEDLEAVQTIYAHHVLNGLGTFEEVPPSIQEIAQRHAAVCAKGLPWLAADVDGRIAGYAYAGPFRPRAAYRYTVEDSVYVAPDCMGRGLGKALLNAVITRCEALGLRQMVAVIGDSGNAGSIGVHRSCGFEFKTAVQSVGWKFGRWVDVVWMQRALNGGDASPPDAPGLDLGGG
jgi:phosphinothricin acetyltransferase